MATFSARTASPLPPSRTPAGSRASGRHASIAPRTTSARGPRAWDAPRTRTHRSIPAPSTQWELHTSHEQSLARLPLELLNDLAQIPAHEFRVPIDCSRVLDTTYFFAALIVWAKGSIQSGLAPVGSRGRHGESTISL